MIKCFTPKSLRIFACCHADRDRVLESSRGREAYQRRCAVNGSLHTRCSGTITRVMRWPSRLSRRRRHARPTRWPPMYAMDYNRLEIFSSGMVYIVFSAALDQLMIIGYELAKSHWELFNLDAPTLNYICLSKKNTQLCLSFLSLPSYPSCCCR